MKRMIVLLFVGITFISYSQEKLEFINSEDLNIKQKEKYDNDDIDGAIEIMDKISPNDTAYFRFKLAKTIYLFTDKRYEEAIEASEVGVTCKELDLQSEFVNYKGLSLIKLEKYEDALTVYQEGLKTFPKNYLFYYNIGVIYDGLKNYAKAVESLQYSLKLNPYYSFTHLKLGVLASQEGKVSKSLMCFNMYLMLNPEGKGSFSILQMLNNVMSSKVVAKKLEGQKAFDKDHTFDEIDLIINNLAALNKKYKVPNKIGIAAVKQNYAFMQQVLTADLDEDDYWVKHYVPIFKDIFKRGMFNSFVYTICYSVENSKYKNLVTKNTGSVKDFIKYYYPKVADSFGKNNELFNSKEQPVLYSYYNGSLSEIGEVNKEGFFEGYIEFYNKEGSLRSKGFLNNEGNRDSNWVWYNNLNNVINKQTYKNGKLHGSNINYHDNGRIREYSILHEGLVEGIYKEFDLSGALRILKTFENDTLHGAYTTYYSTGENAIDYQLDYHKGELQDQVVELLPNGMKIYESPYEKGKKNGVVKNYYSNGKLLSEMILKDGQLEGKYTKYYSTGEKMEEGIAVDNYYEGQYFIYYRNGKIKKEINYEKGYYEGLVKEYQRTGELFNELEYKKGDIISYKYFDKKGSILQEGKKSKGKFFYNGLHENGNVYGNGNYDVDGGKIGEWKYYTRNGVLEEKSFYKDFNLEGDFITYHNNGEVKGITKYVNDTIQGFFVSLYPHGMKKQQCYYVDGLTEGELRNYYQDGTLSSVNFYHHDELNGIQQYFNVGGILDREVLFDDGKLLNSIYYREDGSIIQKVDFDQDSSFMVTLLYPNGKTMSSSDFLYGKRNGKYVKYGLDGKKLIEGNYLNDFYHGDWVWYHDNGKEKAKVNFVFGDYDGEYLSYFESGKLERKNYYEMGDPCNTWERYNENGLVVRRYHYEDGLEHGGTEFYSGQGDLQLVRYYDYGELIAYSYSGANGELVPLIPIKNETAEIISYYPNGKVARSMTVKNGWFESTYNSYYIDGALEKESINVNNEYEGIVKFYYPNNNQLKSERNYSNGQLIGESKHYYKNGNLKRTTYYLNDEKHGEEVLYFENGSVNKKRSFVDGIEQGDNIL